MRLFKLSLADSQSFVLSREMPSHSHRGRRRTAHVDEPPSSSPSDHDSDDSGSVSSDTTDDASEVELDPALSTPQKRRRSSAAAGRGDGRHSTMMIVVALGVLVVLVSGIAAYFYLDERPGDRGEKISDLERVVMTSTLAAEMRESAAARREEEEEGASRASTESSRTKDRDDAGDATLGRDGESLAPNESSRTGTEKPSSRTGAAAGGTPTAAPTKGTQTAGTLGCKKGVGYNTAAYTQHLDICWAYDWDSKGSGLKDGVMYIPMLWGAKTLDGWEAAVDAAIKNGATHVLGFNEPDLAEQANLSPSAAASLWSSAIEPLATKNVKLVSPAVSNGVATKDGKPMGVPWMLEFLEACQGCTIDAVALHWYDSASNLEYFRKHLEDAHAKLSKPIWLTEFMGTGTATDQAAFVTSSVEWLEQQDYIEAYAAFGDFCDNPIANFVDCAGVPNDLGKAYSDA
ncbi:hypothetical protein JCM11491_005831 [Sporobolomyces phaffii]